MRMQLRTYPARFYYSNLVWERDHTKVEHKLCLNFGWEWSGHGRTSLCLRVLCTWWLLGLAPLLWHFWTVQNEIEQQMTLCSICGQALYLQCISYLPHPFTSNCFPFPAVTLVRVTNKRRGEKWKWKGEQENKEGGKERTKRRKCGGI